MKFAEFELRYSSGTSSSKGEEHRFPVGAIIGIGRSTLNDITLSGSSVSSKHCSIEIEENTCKVSDLNSSNGTFFLKKSISDIEMRPGQHVTIAGVADLLFLGYVNVEEKNSQQPEPESKTRYIGARFVVEDDGHESGDEQQLNVAEFSGDMVDVRTLDSNKFKIDEYRYLALGGGIGSFVFVDHMRIFGVEKKHIGVIGDNPVPYGNYERYCKNSQIPPHERLRSNSLSTPDNIWGFPGYASREAWEGVNKGHLSELKHLFTVFGEPSLAISYTPRANHVFRSMDKEANRIGWANCFVQGRIRAMRKTNDGRYAVLYRRHDANGPKMGIALSRYIHLATGYPAVRFLGDLQQLKASLPTLKDRVINAYDPHTHVYQEIASRNDTVVVVVRGRGIVASRILQRLSEIRVKNRKLKILHLLRSKREYGTGARYGWSKRPVFNDVEIQPFNWPKACWSGNLREKIEDMQPAERAATYKILGGTTTAERDDWTALVEVGAREGWYEKYYGDVVSLDGISSDTSKIVCNLDVAGAVTETRQFEADFIIDCTGLIADLGKAPFLRDLISTYHLPRNNASAPGTQPVFSGLQVSGNFEITAMRNQGGKVYASGQVVGGGPYAAVDSFLGLQYCALRSVEDLAATRSSGVRRLSAWRSMRQWRRWCRSLPPES